MFQSSTLWKVATQVHLKIWLIAHFLQVYKHLITNQIKRYKNFFSILDVFSLGIVFYEMLHGNLKFPNKIEQKINFGQGKTTPFLILSLWKDPDLKVEYDSSLNKAVVHLLENMLKINPDERYDMQKVMMHPCLAKSKSKTQV